MIDKYLQIKSGIIAALCLLMTTALPAQNSIMTEQQMDFSVSASISKQYNGTNIVNCSRGDNGSGSVFSFVDSYQNVSRVFIPSVSVNNFVIDNDSLFFCGNMNNKQYGVAGCFDIDDFFFGSNNFTLIYRIPYYSYDTTRNLTSLVSYVSQNGPRHIVAIEETEEIGESPYLIDITLASDTMVKSWRADSTMERLYDIAVTDNYVVTVGMNYDSIDPRLSLRAFNRNNPVVPHIATIRHLVPNSTTTAVVDRGARITAQTGNGDFVTVLSYSHGIGSRDHVYDTPMKTRLSEFDASVLMTNGGTSGAAMTRAALVDRPDYNDNQYPVQIYWDQNNTSYVVVHSIKDPALTSSETPGSENSFYELPASCLNAYTPANAFYLPSFVLNSADGFNGNGYVVSGVRDYNSSDIIQLFGTQTSCAPFSTVLSLPTDPIPTIDIEDVCGDLATHYRKQTFTAQPFDGNINVECNQ